MTEQSGKRGVDLVFTDEVPEPPPTGRRLFMRAALLVVALLVVAVLTVQWIVGQREREVHRDLAQRSEIFAGARAQILGSWLESLAAAGQRFSRSDVFRLFAAETALSGPGARDETALAAQQPYMIQALTDFVRQEQLAGAYLIDRESRLLLASGSAPELRSEQRTRAAAVFDERVRRLGPARRQGESLVVDVFMPVAPPQDENPATPSEVVGVLVLTVPVQVTLSERLEPSPLARPGERTRLMQVADGTVREILPGGAELMRPVADSVDDGGPLAAGQVLPFGARAAVGGNGAVFSYGAPVPGIPWIVVQETDRDSALAPLRAFRWTVVTIAALVTLTFVAAFVAVWWRQASEHNQATAQQYKSLSARIAAQRRFLDSLMSTASELIGLKGPDGRYSYANPALARAVGREPDEIPGLDDAEIFGRGTAERLRQSDTRVLERDVSVVVEEQVYLPEGRRYLQISKVPYRGEDGGEVAGILAVARDVTEIREAEERRNRAVRAMTHALVYTVEQADPYLSGHSQNVRDIGLAIGRELALEADQLATIETSAMLSQIGKLSIPRSIVAKDARLTPEEIEVMQSHVTHARKALEGIDFGLPILETISQMHERLDGSGYPEGLSGDAISLPGRVLAVADVFAARIEARSYRPAIPPEEALRILAEHPARYDADVVAALARVTRSVEGEKLLARIRDA